MNKENSSPNQKPQDLIESALKALRSRYVVVGTKHIPLWKAGLLIGLVVGVAAGILLVANRSGEVTKSEAAFPCVYRGKYFAQEFQTAFDLLLSQNWQESGNWTGDLNDAPSFAPFILYKRAGDCFSLDYFTKANRTVEYLVGESDKLLQELLKGTINYNTFAAVFSGHMGYLDAVQWYRGSAVTRAKVQLYSRAGILAADLAALLLPPGALSSIISPWDSVTVSAMAADDSFRLWRGGGGRLFALMGFAVVEDANKKFWVTSNYGSYYAEDPTKKPWDWNQGYMLAALAEVYHLTQDPRYITFRDASVQTLETHAWDATRGGYYCSVFPTQCLTKGLSNNLVMMLGTLKWRDATGEAFYRDRSFEIMDFIKKELYGGGRFYHDWNFNAGTSTWFCTGCNFFSLDNIYMLNTRVFTADDTVGASSVGALQSFRRELETLLSSLRVDVTTLWEKQQTEESKRNFVLAFWVQLFQQLIKNHTALESEENFKNMLPNIFSRFGSQVETALQEMSFSPGPTACDHCVEPKPSD